MFNPWSYQCEVVVGPIDPERELRLVPSEAIKYIDRVRNNKSKAGKKIEKAGGFLVHKTRFNYFDGKQQIGVACGEYADLTVLQNLKRFLLQPDIGFMVDGNGSNNEPSADRKKKHVHFDDSNQQHYTYTLGELLNDPRFDSYLNDCANLMTAAQKKGTTSNVDENGANNTDQGVHSDLYRRQVPRESLLRLLDMPIFNGTNVKNAVQSGKSLLYYLMTYLLANCMRMYVLPGSELMCFSAILPLRALCTIFGMNIDALPKRTLIPIEKTPYKYLKESNKVLYMFVFPPNISYLDRRDPVIHDGSIDTCDKLFLTDDEFSDFRVNCTLYCRNRNEDYDGDTNNPGFCKGIESHAEIKYNMRTQLMPLLRNRHIFSQNVLFRVFAILAVDPPYEDAFALIERNSSLSVEQDLYENILRVIEMVDVVKNPNAKKRAVEFFSDNYVFYDLHVRQNLWAIHRAINESERELEEARRSGADLQEVYINNVQKLGGVWKPCEHATMANCFSTMDNVIRTMALVLGDAYTTKFVDDLLRRAHEQFFAVFIGEQPLCFPNIVNVMSTAKGSFDDILLLQRNFEREINSKNPYDVSLALTDLLQPIAESKLTQYKNYLDNFVYGSKKVPKNSKLAVSTKWTLQNVIYFDGDLYINKRVVFKDCFRVFSFEPFLDLAVVSPILEEKINELFGNTIVEEK